MRDLLEQESIQVAHQQTRFLIAENDQSKEIDIQDLEIHVKSQEEETAAGAKAKKSKTATTEILAHAHLRIKTGIHYCFVGKNGAGKTTIAQAIGRHLIPGLNSLNLRIATLDQRNAFDANGGTSTVLDIVVHSDPVRKDVQRKVDFLTTAADDGTTIALARAYRQLQFEKGKHELFMLEKLAKLRSRGIGYNVRADLRKQELKVDELTARLEGLAINSSEDETLDDEAKEASQILSELQVELEAMPLRDLEDSARYILRGLGFRDEMLSQDVKKLSGGWQMRCLLAAALVQPADLLILDEPTNHLDLLGILWLQKHLLKVKEDHPDRSVIVISHDRDFVNAACEELILLQEKKLVYFPGNFDSYDKSIYRERLRLTRMQEAQDKQVAHMKQSIADNMRQGKKNNDDGKLKQAKSRQKKLDDRIGMNVSAKGTRFKLNRDLSGYHLTSRAAIELPYEESGVSMAFPTPTNLHPPGSLVSLENASLKYKGAAKAIIDDIGLVVHPGDRIGVLGLNGAGKSTLIKLLTNALPTSTGTSQLHPRAKIGYYSQLSVDALAKQGRADLSLTALSLALSKAAVGGEGASPQEQPVRALLAGLGLQGKTASDTPLAKLSGGQIVRLALALLLLDPPHLLVLDEPTTHLDVYTVTALAKALQAYEGAIVLVSHDRFLIRAVVEGQAIDQPGDDDSDDQDSRPLHSGSNHDDLQRRRVVYEVKNGKVRLCEGGVDAWEASLEKRMVKMGLLQ